MSIFLPASGAFTQDRTKPVLVNSSCFKCKLLEAFIYLNIFVKGKEINYSEAYHQNEHVQIIALIRNYIIIQMQNLPKS